MSLPIYVQRLNRQLKDSKAAAIAYRHHVVAEARETKSELDRVPIDAARLYQREINRCHAAYARGGARC